MKNKLSVKKHIDLKKKLKTIQNTTVKVGFPEESPETQSSDEDGVTAIFKAVRNNFGIGVPRRPFMEIAFAKNEREYKKIIIRALGKIEKLDMVKFSNKLGLKAQGDVQQSIVNLRSPSNSAFTIKMKGSSNPLIDSGHMLQSVTFQVIQGNK